MMQISEWQLIAPHCNHSDKGKAIRALTGDNRFIKDIDYKVFTQNGKNPTEGRSTIDLFNLRASDKARVSISFFLIISLYLLIFIFIIFIISSFALIAPTSYSNQHILYP